MAELIDELSRRAFEAGATDLFLCEDEVPRMRINGELGSTDDEPVDSATLIEFWKRCGCDPGKSLERDVSYLIPGGHRLSTKLWSTKPLQTAPEAAISCSLGSLGG